MRRYSHGHRFREEKIRRERQREFHLDNVRWLPHRAQACNNPRGRTRDTVRLTCPLGVRVALPREMKIRNEGIELSACGP